MASKFFIKGLNTCVMRRQNVRKYTEFLLSTGFIQIDQPQDADYIILWTCSFRADVRDMSLNTLSDLATLYPEKNIVVTGCMPDIYPQLLKNLPYKNIILSSWKDEQTIFRSIFRTSKQFADRVYVEERITDNLNLYREEFPKENIMFCDQFIKVIISEGCNCKCSYCSERLSFPKYRSHLTHDILESLQKLVIEQGVYDIALMADSLGEFGVDTNESFIGLLHAICAINDNIRIALNNFHPKFFIKFFSELKNMLISKRLCHVNLPIQSASDVVLKRMKRDYTQQDLIKIFDLFNIFGFRAFDTHIIVGFPGETDEDFKQTVDFLCTKNPSYVLASAYMESPLSDSAILTPKIQISIIDKRLSYLQKRLSQNGIIVNTDGSTLAKDRIKRVLES